MMKQHKFTCGSKIFFTSDTHFGHSHVIGFCKRPYGDVNEMNEALIKNWNDTVPEDGIVFFLGDFGWGSVYDWQKILDRLNGTIYFIAGNHDLKNVYSSQFNDIKGRFTSIHSQMYIEIEGTKIYLNHFPLLCYPCSNNSYGKSRRWNLFGHVHSGPNSTSNDIPRLEICYATQYDVGVDNNNYKPISFYEIRDIINKKIENEK